MKDSSANTPQIMKNLPKEQIAFLSDSKSKHPKEISGSTGKKPNKSLGVLTKISWIILRISL